MTSSKSKIRKLMALCLAFILLMPVLAACSKGDDGNDSEKERVLRIALMGYGPEDDWFRQQFTEIFEFTNKNIKIETVPIHDEEHRYQPMKEGEKPFDAVAKLKEVLQGPNPPDIVMADGLPVLKSLIDDNLLKDLDTYIKKDKFDVKDIVPSVINGIKMQGDNKIYALAPMFSSNALFYNKKIFDEAGVEYPKDNMTWDDIFNLARRVAKGEGENRIYGFAFNNYMGSDMFGDMNTYAAPLQLQLFDDKAENMTVDSPAWEKVIKTMLQLKSEKLVPEQPDFSKPRPEPVQPRPFDYDAFLSGRVAMAIGYSGYVNEINNANKSKMEGFNPIDWDVVTVPQHADVPGVGGSVGLSGIMGINAKAQNAADAWKFLSFLNGEDWAKLKSNSTYNFVSRKKYIKPREGLDYNVKAFYTLAPAQNFYENPIFREKQNLYQVVNIGSTKFQDVVKGTKTIKQMLSEWQNEGNNMLKQIKENPNGPIPGPGGPDKPLPID